MLPGLTSGQTLGSCSFPTMPKPPVLIEGCEREGSSPKFLHVPYGESP